MIEDDLPKLPKASSPEKPIDKKSGGEKSADGEVLNQEKKVVPTKKKESGSENTFLNSSIKQVNSSIKQGKPAYKKGGFKKGGFAKKSSPHAKKPWQRGGRPFDNRRVSGFTKKRRDGETSVYGETSISRKYDRERPYNDREKPYKKAGNTPFSHSRKGSTDFHFKKNTVIRQEVLFELRKYLYNSKDRLPWKIKENDPLSDSNLPENLLDADGVELTKLTEELEQSQQNRWAEASGKVINNDKKNSLIDPPKSWLRKTKLEESENEGEPEDTKTNDIKIQLPKTETLKEDDASFAPELDEAVETSPFRENEAADSEENSDAEELVYLGEEYAYRIAASRKRTLARIWVMQNLHSFQVRKLLPRFKQAILDDVDPATTETLSSRQGFSVLTGETVASSAEHGTGAHPVDKDKTNGEVKNALETTPPSKTLRNKWIELFNVSSAVTLTDKFAIPLVDLGSKNQDFCWNLLKTVLCNSSKIDALISDNLKGWRIERLTAAKISLLRLSVAELVFDATPNAVVINEATDLAKWALELGEHRFINGILEKIALKDTLQ